MADLVTGVIGGIAVHLVSDIVYEFAKHVAKEQVKYFPNALMFSRDALLELDSRVEKFLVNKRWQHSATHPLLYSYFTVADDSDLDRLRPLICAALLDEDYSAATCKDALLALQVKEIEKLDKADDLAKATRTTTQAKPPSVNRDIYSLNSVNIDKFTEENLRALKSTLFEHDEISRRFIRNLKAAPSAFAIAAQADSIDTENQRNYELLKEYCQEVYASVSNLMTSGIDAFLRQEQIESQLEASFVSLSLTDLWKSNDDVFTESADQIFQNFQYVVARGDAGSGKTTLLQWICLQCAKNMLDAPQAVVGPSGWRATVPVFVPLRRIVTSFEGRINVSDFAVLSTGSRDFSLKVNVAWIEWVLTENSTVIMLDGVDELPFSERHRLPRMSMSTEEKCLP